jgi:hypothetical protein
MGRNGLFRVMQDRQNCGKFPGMGGRSSRLNEAVDEFADAMKAKLVAKAHGADRLGQAWVRHQDMECHVAALRYRWPVGRSGRANLAMMLWRINGGMNPAILGPMFWPCWHLSRCLRFQDGLSEACLYENPHRKRNASHIGARTREDGCITGNGVSVTGVSATW